MNNISKKIFLTGHNGLVGSSFKKILSKNKNIRIFTQNRSELDLFNFENLENYIKKIKPNYIINCAAKVGGIEANQRDQYAFFLENYNIQQNLIKISISNKIDKLILLGSSCIYGNNFLRPIKESQISFSNLESTNEGYSLSKLIGYKLLDYANKQYGLDYLHIMPCNIFGENSDFNSTNSHVLEALVRKLILSKKINSKEVVIWGDGLNRREFITAKNLAINTVNLLEKNFSGTYNVGLGYDFSIKQLIKIIKKNINYNPKIIFDRKKPKGTYRKVLNLSKIKKTGCYLPCDFNKELKSFISLAEKKFLY